MRMYFYSSSTCLSRNKIKQYVIMNVNWYIFYYAKLKRCKDVRIKMALLSFEDHFKRRMSLVPIIHARSPWFCSDTQSRWSVIYRVYAHDRHTRHDAWRWSRRRDRRATDFLLCDFLLARFQALSIKSPLCELPKTTFCAARREIGSRRLSL